MIRYDCKYCFENVFDVVDIEHLDTLPRTWVCSGCGRKYTGKLNDSGNLIVYQKGYERHATVYGNVPAGPEELLAPEPGPPEEELAEESAGEPGTEEPAEELGPDTEELAEEPAAAEEPPPGFELPSEPEPGTGDPAEEVE